MRRHNPRAEREANGIFGLIAIVLLLVFVPVALATCEKRPTQQVDR